MLQTLILLLMSLVPHHTDTETAEQREVRMTIIAKAIMAAVDEQTCHGRWKSDTCKRQWKGPRKVLVISLVTQGKFESHFAQRVHAGRCERTECDPRFVKDPKTKQYLRDAEGRKVVVFMARNVFQVQARHPGPDRQLWEGALGDEYLPTETAARLAARYLTRRQCGGDVAQMFQSQDGRGCRALARGKRRAAEFNELMTKFDRIAWSLKHAENLPP